MQRTWEQALAPREVFKSQKAIAMRFLNARVLERKSLNHNLSWGFPLGNLHPKTRVLKHRVLERNASVLGTQRFRTLRTQNKGPHKLFSGNSGVKKGVPNGPFWTTAHFARQGAFRAKRVNHFARMGVASNSKLLNRAAPPTKVPHRTCVTKTLLNFQVHFLVQSATTKPR